MNAPWYHTDFAFCLLRATTFRRATEAAYRVLIDD